MDNTCPSFHFIFFQIVSIKAVLSIVIHLIKYLLRCEENSRKPETYKIKVVKKSICLATGEPSAVPAGGGFRRPVGVK